MGDKPLSGDFSYGLLLFFARFHLLVCSMPYGHPASKNIASCSDDQAMWAYVPTHHLYIGCAKNGLFLRIGNGNFTTVSGRKTHTDTPI